MESGEITLAGVHKGGACGDYAVPHFAIRISHPPYLEWIKRVTGIF